MDEISSSEFRKIYATLTEPTDVTVLGRVIGRWVPAMSRLSVKVGRDEMTFDPPPMKDQPVEISVETAYPYEPGSLRSPSHPDLRFNSRPFTPAPKTKGK